MGALSRLRAVGSNVQAEYDEMVADGPTESQPILLSMEQLRKPQIYKPIVASLGLSFFQQVRNLKFTVKLAVSYFIVRVT